MSEEKGVFLFWIGKTEVRMSLLFPGVIAFLCLIGGDGRRALLCLSASFMHEGGHLLAMLLTDTKPSRIFLGGFGMRIELSHVPALSYRKAAYIAAGGPLESAVAAAVMFVCGAGETAWIHLLLCALNVLPISPLDGGQVLYALLQQRLSPERVQRITGITALCFLLPLTVLSLYLLQYSRYNATLLIVCVYLLFLQIRKVRIEKSGEIG